MLPLPCAGPLDDRASFLEGCSNRRDRGVDVDDDGDDNEDDDRGDNDDDDSGDDGGGVKMSVLRSLLEVGVNVTECASGDENDNTGDAKCKGSGLTSGDNTGEGLQQRLAGPKSDRKISSMKKLVSFLAVFWSGRCVLSSSAVLSTALTPPASVACPSIVARMLKSSGALAVLRLQGWGFKSISISFSCLIASVDSTILPVFTQQLRYLESMPRIIFLECISFGKCPTQCTFSKSGNKLPFSL